MQEIYEKLGLFYLGKEIDKQSMETTEALTLLKFVVFVDCAIMCMSMFADLGVCGL